MMFVGISIVLGLSFFAATASAELVRTAIPRATVNYLSLPVAEVKGFFRTEGLENETIVIPGTTAIAALVSGNVDYSGAGFNKVKQIAISELEMGTNSKLLLQFSDRHWNGLGCNGDTYSASGYQNTQWSGQT